MNQKLKNVQGIYLEGIKEGKAREAVTKFTGSRYTQHSTGVRDGIEGFVEFFEPFIKRNPVRDIQIIRGIVDGEFVFVTAYQNINNGEAKWITTDLFDTDENNKIVEHWDVIGPYQEADKTVSGNDMILGDFEIKDLDKTEANKIVVRNFITDVFQNKNHGAIEKYISTEEYIQHNATLPNGINAIKEMLTTQDVNYDFIFKIIGQGNYVVSYSKVISSKQDLAVFDIFRLENGKIVEHWDNMESIPPRNEWVNTGKF